MSKRPSEIISHQLSKGMKLEDIPNFLDWLERKPKDHFMRKSINLINIQGARELVFRMINKI